MATQRVTTETVEVGVQLGTDHRVTTVTVEVARRAKSNKIVHGRRVGLSFGRGKGN